VEKYRIIVYDWVIMETNRLRQFCVVFETENLRKAAEVLGMSHSALSKSLKVLQGELNLELLMQSGRNIIITDEGKAFYKKALEFLKQEEILLTKVAVDTKTLRLGTFEVFSTHLIGTYWHKYFKDTQLDLYELLPGELERALVNGEIDIGITYEPIATKGIEFIKIGTIEMGIYARADMFPASTKIERLAFAAPIRPIQGTPTGVKGLDGWPDDMIPRNVVYKVDMMESGLAFARQGLAAIFVPHFVAKSMNLGLKAEFKLQQIPYPGKVKPVKRSVYLVKRSNQVETSLVRTLGKLVRGECLT
jgi:DNA-binding transcriptional LysR family regulator